MLIAHLVNTGLGPFYDGITHLAMTPEDILPVLALAALAGLGGTARGRTLLALLPAAWLLGGLLGLRHDAEISMPIVSRPSHSWHQAHWSRPTSASRPLSSGGSPWGSACFRISEQHGHERGGGGGGVVGLAGIVSAVFVALTLIAAFVVSLEPQWARVTVRVSGSWIAAIGLLMLGWSLQGAVG